MEHEAVETLVTEKNFGAVAKTTSTRQEQTLLGVEIGTRNGIRASLVRNVVALQKETEAKTQASWKTANSSKQYHHRTKTHRRYEYPNRQRTDFIPKAERKSAQTTLREGEGRGYYKAMEETPLTAGGECGCLSAPRLSLYAGQQLFEQHHDKQMTTT